MNEITLEMAETMLDATERWVGLVGSPCSIAIVDRSGHLIALRAMDGSQPMFPDIAISKAFSAVYFGGSIHTLAKFIDPRNIGPIPGSYYIGLLTQLKGRLNCIPGGEPIRNHQFGVIGGIGVSGIPQGVGEISDTTACVVGISAFYDNYVYD